MIHFPPIFLDTNCNYGLELIAFYSYSTIQNVHSFNNKLHFKKFDGSTDKVVVPPGAYVITEIAIILEREMINKGLTFRLQENLNTFKCEILSDVELDFTHKESIGKLLGF